MLKIGLDIHGVIDSDPDFFRELTRKLHKEGHMVFVLTGREICNEILQELNSHGIYYDELFSITSYHKSIGTHMSYLNGDKTQPLINPIKWDRTKADYAERVGLDIHFDDSIDYKEYFVGKTQYILFSPAIKSFLETLTRI